jgi:hypothetical protein
MPLGYFQFLEAIYPKFLIPPAVLPLYTSFVIN